MELYTYIHSLLFELYKGKTRTELLELALGEIWDTFPVKRVPLLAMLAGSKGLASFVSASAISLMIYTDPDPTTFVAVYKVFKKKGDFQEESDVQLEATANIGWGLTDFNTINVGTVSSIIASAAGAKLIKSGSRKFFSESGSGDLLAALNIPRLDNLELARRVLDNTGLAFIKGEAFSPHATNFSKKLTSVPKDVKNVLAALTYPLRFAFMFINPLGAMYGVRGIGLPYTEQFTKALRIVHSYIKRNITLYGENTDNTIIDEATVSGTTHVTICDNERITNYDIKPEDLTELGLRYWKPEDLVIKDASQGYKIAEKLLKGELKKDNPFVHLIALNSAFNLLAHGIVRELKDGVEQSFYVIESGLGIKKVNEYKEYVARWKNGDF